MVSTQNQLKWEACGILADPVPNKNKGVYVFVFLGKVRRIIYVGTTFDPKGFSKRWNDHKRLFLNGERTVFKVKNNEDIYDLMSDKGDRKEYIENALLEKPIWVPGNPKYDFNTNWEKYVCNEYLQRIELWACKTPDEQLSEIIESQIQICFGHKFQLGYCEQVRQNWLGCTETRKSDKCLTHMTKFGSLPDLDQESCTLLNNLLGYILDHGLSKSD